MFLIHYANVARLSPSRLRSNQFRLNTGEKHGVYIMRLADKRAQRRFPRAERCHVVARSWWSGLCTMRQDAEEDKTEGENWRTVAREGRGGGGEGGICSKTSKQPAFPFMSYYAEARTHIGKCLTALCRRCLTRSRENIKTRPIPSTIPHRIDFFSWFIQSNLFLILYIHWEYRSTEGSILIKFRV